MDIKTKLKERILEIPINDKAFREKHRFANDLDIKLKDIETLLNELVEKEILKEKIQYVCPNCGDTTIMDDELLKEILDEEEGTCFLCDNCMDFVNPSKNRTGYVFYDIKDKQALKEF